MDEATLNEPRPTVVRHDDEFLLKELRLARKLIAQHPRLTSSIISTLVEEGRAFGRTDQGQRLRTELLSSEAVDRAHLVWDALGLQNYVGRAPAFGPRRWLGLFASAAESPRVEELLSRLFVEGEDER
jgi:hypothetical protein